MIANMLRIKRSFHRFCGALALISGVGLNAQIASAQVGSAVELYSGSYGSTTSAPSGAGVLTMDIPGFNNTDNNTGSTFAPIAITPAPRVTYAITENSNY